MFGLFRKKSHIDEDFFSWSISVAQWVIENFDGLEQLRRTPLVTPTAQYFPKTDAVDHAFAEYVAERIKILADMRSWKCVVTAQSERPPGFLGDSVLQKFDVTGPLGTFSEKKHDNEQIAYITYDPDLLQSPISLIATLSHEFAHYLMRTCRTAPPGGWEQEEPVTDALAILMGFGVFIANDSSSFDTTDRSWSASRRGYLCEGEILHVLSAFLFLSGNGLEDAVAHLKPHLAKRLRRIHAEAILRDGLSNLAQAKQAK